MNKQVFYSALRSRGNTLFGTSLSQDQVDGLERMLNEGERRGTPLKHLAYIMATALHEAGPKLQPIRENLNYTSATRIRQVWPSRFPTVSSAVPFVRNPAKLADKVYGDRADLGNTQVGDGSRFMGRGYVQITGRANYRKFGIEASPDDALEPATAIRIMFDGMERGLFTGKRLSDYINGKADYYNARAIVNADKAANGAAIVTKAKAFQAALEAAGYTRQKPQPLPTPSSPAPKPQPEPQPTPAPAQGFWAALANFLRNLFSKG